MTQVKSAQRAGKKLALRPASDGRSLAQRRAAFAAQMREMALSDLDDVSARLKSLHAELERVDGRRWTHYDLADKMGIRPRTFQSWENGEVENRDGKGYDKMARYYSRRLGRKITRQWILFGDNAAKVSGSKKSDESSATESAEAGDEIRAKLDELLEGQQELLATIEEMRDERARPQPVQERDAPSETARGN